MTTGIILSIVVVLALFFGDILIGNLKHKKNKDVSSSASTSVSTTTSLQETTEDNSEELRYLAQVCCDAHAELVAFGLEDELALAYAESQAKNATVEDFLKTIEKYQAKRNEIVVARKQSLVSMLEVKIEKGLNSTNADVFKLAINNANSKEELDTIENSIKALRPRKSKVA